MSLRKEMVIAILLGLAMGGVAALMLTELPQRLLGKTPNQNTDSQQLSPTPSPFTTEGLTLAILVPDNQTYIEEDTITISGKTQPNVNVILTANIDETVVNSDDDGAFSGDIKLTEGANEIYAYVLYEDQEVEESIIINYLEPTDEIQESEGESE